MLNKFNFFNMLADCFIFRPAKNLAGDLRDLDRICYANIVQMGSFVKISKT